MDQQHQQHAPEQHYAGVSRDWGDADGSDMTGWAAAGLGMVDGPGIAADRDEG